MPHSHPPKRVGIWENFESGKIDLPKQAAPRRRPQPSPGPDTTPLPRSHFLLTAMALGAPALLFEGLRVRFPGALGWGIALAVFGVGLYGIYMALRAHTEALRSVAFYNRFIRPGLKRLLEAKGPELLVGDEKFFRGRKTVILKIDMANYTRTTFNMPYGMRRLFQDLWFTLIDRVVAQDVFLDKNLGDGSVYCFEGELPGGSCTKALRAALEIHQHQVRAFDDAYRERLARAMAKDPELAAVAETYFEQYRADTGHDFSERQTQIRIALVSGYVDEGLWGLPSQSHYDIQGGPVVIATRLEAAAKNGEIVFDRNFLEELEAESPGLLDPASLELRHVDLKGIGNRELFALSPGQSTES